MVCSTDIPRPVPLTTDTMEVGMAWHIRFNLGYSGHHEKWKVEYNYTIYPFPLYFSSLSTVVHISIHTVSCSKVSMSESLFCKVLHSICYIDAHLNLYTLDREESKTSILHIRCGLWKCLWYTVEYFCLFWNYCLQNMHMCNIKYYYTGRNYYMHENCASNLENISNHVNGGILRDHWSCIFFVASKTYHVFLAVSHNTLYTALNCNWGITRLKQLSHFAVTLWYQSVRSAWDNCLQSLTSYVFTQVQYTAIQWFYLPWLIALIYKVIFIHGWRLHQQWLLVWGFLLTNFTVVVDALWVLRKWIWQPPYRNRFYKSSSYGQLSMHPKVGCTDHPIMDE